MTHVPGSGNTANPVTPDPDKSTVASAANAWVFPIVAPEGVLIPMSHPTGMPSVKSSRSQSPSLYGVELPMYDSGTASPVAATTAHAPMLSVVGAVKVHSSAETPATEITELEVPQPISDSGTPPTFRLHESAPPKTSLVGTAKVIDVTDEPVTWQSVSGIVPSAPAIA